jgi:hypothetical protein
MWHRVFGLSTAVALPSQLAEHLHERGLAVEPHFKGDELGWTRGELVLPGGGTAITLERFLTEEDDLRDDLNVYAAQLETMNYSPNNVSLMERVINTKQLITIRRPIDHANESRLDSTLLAVCQFLASSMDGIYQIDESGWYTADGVLLLQEY